MGRLFNHTGFNLVPMEDHFFFPAHTAPVTLHEQNHVCTSFSLSTLLGVMGLF